MAIEQQLIAQQETIRPNVKIPTPPTASTPNINPNIVDKPQLAADDSSTSTGVQKSTDNKRDAAATTADDTAKIKKPDWLTRPPHREGDNYVVGVDALATPENLREEMLSEKIRAAANSYIDEVLYRQPYMSDIVALDPDYVEKNCVKEKVNDPNGIPYGAKLVFDQHFRDEVDRKYRKYLSLGHLEQLAGFAGAGLILLGGVYGYLRLTPRRATATAAVSSAPGDVIPAGADQAVLNSPGVATGSLAQKKWSIWYVLAIAAAVLVFLMLLSTLVAPTMR